MNAEKQPLLGEHSRIEIHMEDEDNNSTDSLLLQQGSINLLRYGTNSGSIAKTLPADERITYSWNGINAFTSARQVTRRKYFCMGERIVVGGTERKHILKDVSGIAYPGELLAILGSSGAGKTTLLNTLTFRSTNSITVTGVRTANEVHVNLKSLASVSAYVQQSELFIGSLTVKEHLIFQALVRMDRNITYEHRMRRVEEVLSELSLKKCEYSTIGNVGGESGISGGEKKRLSFAAEVLTNPPLMFCDEPTSGLDSFMALNVVEVLKKMANSGKTVMCTIHQPSSELYGLFDKLLLMAEGRVAFLGTPDEADIFFTELEAPCPRNYNPADYYIQLLAVEPEKEESCKQAINMICDKYHRSDIGIQMLIETATRAKDSRYDKSDAWFSSDSQRSPYKASWCAQFSAVLWRSWLSITKDKRLVKVRFIQTVMVSLVIGGIYYGQQINQDGVMNINGVLFIYLTNMTFQNVFAVIHVFTSELPVFLRENKNGMYRCDVYFLSKILAETPFFICLPILFTSVSYFMIGLNEELPRFFIACGIVTLVTNSAVSFGYFVSCLASTTAMALSLASPMIIPFLLFGGFFLNVNSIPIYLEWLSYLSWFKYGNEALLVNQWEGITHIDCPSGNTTCPRSGHMILESYNFLEERIVLDIIALFCVMVGFRVLAFLALLRRTYK